MPRREDGRQANGPALRAAREAAGLDRGAVGRRVFMDRSSVSRIEAGSRKFVDPSAIQAFAVLYGVPEESLWLPEEEAVVGD